VHLLAIAQNNKIFTVQRIEITKITDRTFGKSLHPIVDHRSYKYFPSPSVLAPLLGH